MKGIKKLFLNRRGHLRIIWLLSAAALWYTGATVGVYALYWYIYETMMEMWGVTAQNVVRAPGAVRFLYQWSNVLVQMIQSTLLVGGAAILVRWSGGKQSKGKWVKPFGQGSAMGAGCVVLMWCILMILGSVRLGWRFTRPHFSVNTFALLLTTMGAAVGEGLFFYRGLYGSMKKRLCVWAAPMVMMTINVLLVLLSGMFHPIRLISAALTALVCALLTDQIGIGATIGFRWGWSYLDQAVLGFASAQAALYETYPVNLYWLCGGNSGLMCGWLTVGILCGCAAWLLHGKTGEYLPIRRASDK